MEWLSEVNTWRELMTVGSFTLFLWIFAWAYSRKNKEIFDDISQAVVEDCDTDFEQAEQRGSK